MASEGSAAASQLRRSITEASRRVGEIIDDAERAAETIRSEAEEDARTEAQRVVNESAAELASVVSPLVERVENLRVEAASLMDELQVVTESLRKLTQPDETVAKTRVAVDEPAKAQTPEPEVPDVGEAPDPKPDSPDGPVPVAYPGKAVTSGTGASGPPEEALLRATQMAVAGNSRQEIEETLRDEFGLDDPVPVVDDILGTN